eukprot:1369163-Amphidinium_carterae.1
MTHAIYSNPNRKAPRMKPDAFYDEANLLLLSPSVILNEGILWSLFCVKFSWHLQAARTNICESQPRLRSEETIA